jgi:SEC-C motif
MRRNAPCYCGSDKRFKHCHGKFGSERGSSTEVLRRQQQGFGKPIHSYLLRDGRAVVVGRSVMMGKWPTFTNFVLDYFAERIGRQWIASEMKLGEAGHPIAQWAIKMREQDIGRPRGVVAKTTVNNAFRSMLSAAYNLYLIEHHYEQYDQPLFERMLVRFRMKDGFLATLSEANTAASFLKAGFFLEYEDDLRPGQHAEFTANYPPTGRHFSVEVKTRSAVDTTGDLKSRLKLKNKLSQALKKNLPFARVVFIDLNIPETITDVENSALEELLTQIEDAERTLKIKGSPAPSAYLFLVNLATGVGNRVDGEGGRQSRRSCAR